MIIIAEIGSNPAPRWDFRRWVGAAYAAGATHVKAQMFRADHFPEKERDSKRPLEFPRERFAEFVSIAHEYGLKAGVSVFDEEAVNIAAIGDFIKLAAREQFDFSLGWLASKSQLPIYRSVNNTEAIEYDKGTFNYTHCIVLGVVPEYPSSQIKSIYELFRLRRYFISRQLRWGWSSHTRGTLDCLLAVRLGARVIEKHLCICDTDLEAGHSLNISRFAEMSCRIKEML